MSVVEIEHVEKSAVVPFGASAFTVAELKATGPAKGGRFEAIVSVFENIDVVYDRMKAGSFVRTLQAPPKGRGFPPIVWSHNWGVVPIGAAMRAEEVIGAPTEKGPVDGLFIEGELLVAEHQTAKEVYAAMRQKGGDGRPPLREFSFGYRVVKAEYVQETPTLDDGTEGEPLEIRDIYDVDLFEVGPTLVGANDMTALLGVKGLQHLFATAGLPSTTGKEGGERAAPDVGTSKELPDHDVVNETLMTIPAKPGF